MTDLAVPVRARAGQTRPITVTIGNTRYTEDVKVELYKVVGDSPVLIGHLTQRVPAGPDRTVSFAYTFSAADATTTVTG